MEGASSSCSSSSSSPPPSSSSSSSSATSSDDGVNYFLLHKNLLARLVVEAKLNLSVAIGVLSFWIWLESIGHKDCILRIATSSLGTMVVAVEQAESCVLAILMTGSDTITVEARMRARSLATEAPGDIVDLRYFLFYWDKAHKGLCYFIDQVHNQFYRELSALESSMKIYRDVYSDGSVLGPYGNQSMKRESVFGESSSGPRRMDNFGNGDHLHTLISERLRIALNPDETLLGGGITKTSDADGGVGNLLSSLSLSSPRQQATGMTPTVCAWMTSARYVPKDERTLFVTFSNGYPLGESDLFNFFQG